uniref:Potassium voltagegated channel, subfamily H (Eagrelated), member 7 [Anolis carolinensis] n=1 Tax=Lepeophtheirus salmonis TaxID=72036 RepID=A0A0K2U6K5_LEPSM
MIQRQLVRQMTLELKSRFQIQGLGLSIDSCMAEGIGRLLLPLLQSMMLDYIAVLRMREQRGMKEQLCTW